MFRYNSGIKRCLYFCKKFILFYLTKLCKENQCFNKEIMPTKNGQNKKNSKQLFAKKMKTKRNFQTHTMS